MTASTTVKLTGQELTRLSTLEVTVERGQQTFIEVGNALAEIRDSRLYRETHKTFASYCQERWDWSRPRAYQFIKAAEVANFIDDASATGLSTNVDISKPTSEGQVRPLASLDKEQQHAAWTKAHEIAEEENTPVTGEVVRRAVDEIKEPEPARKSLGVGLKYSNEAIAALGRIPPDDALRSQAMDDVISWIEFNR